MVFRDLSASPDSPDEGSPPSLFPPTPIKHSRLEVTEGKTAAFVLESPTEPCPGCCGHSLISWVFTELRLCEQAVASRNSKELLAEDWPVMGDL